MDKSSMEKFLELQKAVQVTGIQLKKYEVDCEIAMKEGNNLRCELEDVKRTATMLTEIHEQTLRKYQSLVAVVDCKRKLSEDLAKLKEKCKETEEAHRKELEELERALKDEVASKTKKLEDLKDEIENEGVMVEAAHRYDLTTKTQKIKELKEEMKEKETKRFDELFKIKKTNHAVLEKLRNQITQLQQSQSSCAVSNMDLISNKLQAVRRKYNAELNQLELKVTNKELENTALKEELDSLKEVLKHQECLNVARDGSSSK